jgi:uncharacterized membrane protein YcgQ (UPF0703/DUF1980 family)
MIFKYKTHPAKAVNFFTTYYNIGWSVWSFPAIYVSNFETLVQLLQFGRSKVAYGYETEC